MKSSDVPVIKSVAGQLESPGYWPARCAGAGPEEQSGRGDKTTEDQCSIAPWASSHKWDRQGLPIQVDCDQMVSVCEQAFPAIPQAILPAWHLHDARHHRQHHSLHAPASSGRETLRSHTEHSLHTTHRGTCWSTACLHTLGNYGPWTPFPNLIPARKLLQASLGRESADPTVA